MFVKQMMYIMDEDMLEANLVQNNRSRDGHVHMLGLGLVKVIGSFYSWMQTSIEILTTEYGVSTVEIPSLPQ